MNKDKQNVGDLFIHLINTNRVDNILALRLFKILNANHCFLGSSAIVPLISNEETVIMTCNDHFIAPFMLNFIISDYETFMNNFSRHIMSDLLTENSTIDAICSLNNSAYLYKYKENWHINYSNAKKENLPIKINNPIPLPFSLFTPGDSTIQSKLENFLFNKDFENHSEYYQCILHRIQQCLKELLIVREGNLSFFFKFTPLHEFRT